MDYVATPIPPDTPFRADEVWARVDECNDFSQYEMWGEPQDSLTINGVDEHWMSYAEGYQSWPLTVGNYPVRINRADVRVKWNVNWPGKVVPIRDARGTAVATRRPQISIFTIDECLDKAIKPIVQPRPSYAVLGTATITGDKPRDIGPLHVPGIRMGRITVQITDAVTTQGDEYGTITVQSSRDGKTWFDLAGSGLSRNTLFVRQNAIGTGDVIADELYLANHGEYIRIHYLPRRIAGWGFRATVTVETSG